MEIFANIVLSFNGEDISLDAAQDSITITTEAVEAAIKFAILTTGKSQFIAMKEGYHGKTIGSLSATSNIKYKKPFKRLLSKFKHVKFGDIKSLKRAINKEL